MRRFNIKTKLILGVGLTIFVFGTIASMATYFVAKDYILELEVLDYRTISQMHAENLKNIFNNSKQLVINLAEHDNIKQYLLNPTHTIQDADVLGILQRRNIEGSYSAIYLMDKNGLTLVSTDTSFVNKNYSFRDYFTQAMAGTPYIDVAIGVTSLQPGYYFSAPIFNNEEVLGVVVMKEIPDKIHDAFSVDEEFHEHDMLFIDEYGVIVGSKDPKFLYQSFGELTGEELASLDAKARYSNIKIENLGYEQIQTDLRRHRLVGELPEELYKLQDKYVSIALIPGTKFLFAEIDDISSIVIAASKLSLFLAGLVFCMAGIAAIIIFSLMKRFSSPVGKILNAMKKFEEDRIILALKLKSGDEFELIYNQFIKLAQEIKKSEKSAKAQASYLREQMEQLERMNKAMIGREKRMAELKEKIKK